MICFFQTNLGIQDQSPISLLGFRRPQQTACPLHMKASHHNASHMFQLAIMEDFAGMIPSQRICLSGEYSWSLLPYVEAFLWKDSLSAI